MQAKNYSKAMKLLDLLTKLVRPKEKRFVGGKVKYIVPNPSVFSHASSLESEEKISLYDVKSNDD